MKLGKRAPRVAEKALRLEAYLPAGLPPAPVSADWGIAVQPAAWGPLGNLDVGDCTCAAIAHAIQVWTAAAGSPRCPADADVLAFYSAVGGYVPGNPLTDQGAVISDVLTRWSTDGLAGDHLAAAAKVDATELEKVKRAIALLGCADIGLELPTSAQSQDIWDVVDDDGGPWGGHCVLLTGYDLDGLTCITWGAPKRLTWAFLARYMDECWALVSSDFLRASGASPDALNLEQMTADLAALRTAS